jgi:hypothetical protein
VVFGGLLATLWVASPASAFAHDRVHNTYLHAVLDVLSLVLVTAPLWTAYAWGLHRRRGLLLALVAVVQVPVAVIAFVPILDPVVHLVSGLAALALTTFSLIAVRRAAPAAAPVADSR